MRVALGDTVIVRVTDTYLEKGRVLETDGKYLLLEHEDGDVTWYQTELVVLVVRN